MTSISKLLLLALPLGITLLQSCSLDGGSNSVTYPSILANNLYIPDDPGAPVTAQSGCSYTFKIDVQTSALVVSTEDLKIDGASYAFTTDGMKYQTYSNGSNGVAQVFKGGSATISSGVHGLNVSGMNGMLTNAFFIYRTTPEIFPVVVSSHMPVMNYYVGDTQVKTFGADTFFSGTTTTTYEMKGHSNTFDTTDAVYRVKFADDMKTANVVIYNVKFASEMPNPLVAVVLKNLDVKLDRNGYTITGSDVEPEMLDSGELVPYPARKFNSFTLSTVNKSLTKISCRYVVADTFKGQFNGVCTMEIPEAGI